MAQSKETRTQTITNLLVKNWHLFFLVCFIEGFFSFSGLISIPADPKNQVFLGLSFSRLLMLAFVGGLSLAFVSLAIKSKMDTSWRSKWLHPHNHEKTFSLFFFLSVFTSITAWAVLFITKLYPEHQLFAFYERLYPPLSWVLLLGIQFSLWLAVLRYGIHTENVSVRRRNNLPILITLLVMAAVCLFIALTGIGVTPDAVAWGEPGVPLLEWHIWLGAFIAILTILVTFLFQKRSSKDPVKTPPAVFDLLLVALIWLLASSLWLSVPIPRSYFSLIPRPPNFEIYPYSDAANHDLISQHILIGNGFENGRVVKRPLLSLFFAVLYVIGGQDYLKIISLQTLILAAFPVFLYLIGKNLHSRPLGLVVAVWGIIRELDIIAATPYARVSHSKHLLSDLPAALGISVFLYFVIKWFKNPHRLLYPVLSGGALGLLMLVRTQSIFLLVLILPAAFLHFRPGWRRWFRGSLLLGMGISLCILPWIIRNWHFTGRIIFDQTEQTGIIAQRYTDLPGYAMPQRLEDESEQEYTQRFMKNTLEFTLNNPASVLQFITAHFINNEISTALVIPIRTSFEDMTEVFTITSPYWGSWVQGLETGQYLVFGFNLAILGAGIASSYRRWHLTGLLPLFANLAYSMSNAIARNSGGRYILPVDWMGYFYFAIGMFEFILFLLLLFGKKRENVASLYSGSEQDSPVYEKQSIKTRTISTQIVLPCILFLLLGSSLPLAEVVFPKLYPPQTRDEMVERIVVNESLLDQMTADHKQIHSFLADEKTTVLSGRAMYPVFLVSGEGEPGFGWPFLEERKYTRMSFYLIGEKNSGVVLPQEEAVTFPNASDVVVAGCMGEGFLEAGIVLVENADARHIYISNRDTLSGCP